MACTLFTIGLASRYAFSAMAAQELWRCLSGRLQRLTLFGARVHAQGGEGQELADECRRLDREAGDAPPVEAAVACLRHQAWDVHHPYKGTDVEWRMYAVLRPRAPLREAIARRVAACGPCFVAVHIRRTDFRALFGVTHGAADADFEAFVLRARADQRVFLATDDAPTQQQLAQRLGPRLCALTPLDASARRPTSVEEAVVDLFTCAAAETFKGTCWSSFSDTIAHLRRCQARAHAADEHLVDSLNIPNAEQSRGVYLHDLTPPSRECLGVFFS